MNPFHYGQIVQKANFCRRPELDKKLANNIKRGQNVYIQGERRTGKTSLICETIRKLKKNRMIYVDLLEVKSSDDFLKRMVTAIMGMVHKGSSIIPIRSFTVQYINNMLIRGPENRMKPVKFASAN